MRHFCQVTLLYFSMKMSEEIFSHGFFLSKWRSREVIELIKKKKKIGMLLKYSDEANICFHFN